MNTIIKVFFVFIGLRFLKKNKDLSFNNLNFKKLDFSNYKLIRSFIFKKNFHEINSKYVNNFDFLNFSEILGGKIGISLSRQSIFGWHQLNKNKIFYPWSEDLTSKRLINMIYNYDFINSSSSTIEKKNLNKIILYHMHRVIFDFKRKRIDQISSYDLIASTLSLLILKKNYEKYISYINQVIDKQIDSFGMHKSYNLVEHAKFLNNLYELKNILLYFNTVVPNKIENKILIMNSTLNEYFHSDGTIPLFNGGNNNYTHIIQESINKENYMKSRDFVGIKNGIAFFSDKNKKLFFDVVQPNNNSISKNLSAGTLSIEFSCSGEKIISNCGASESSGKNPEYLRYSAAHSTIILQNTNISEIKEGNPHIKYPQSVTFELNNDDKKYVYEGSHNGYQRKFSKVVKRKVTNIKGSDILVGEDSILSITKNNLEVIYHIRFHLVSGIVFNFTNNRKNIILRTKFNNMWIFKSDVELIVEDSIIVDKNTTIETKQIVIKGITNKNKVIRKWSLEKI